MDIKTCEISRFRLCSSGNIVKLLLLLFIFLYSISIFSQQTEIVYLSGTDVSNTVDWEFFCTDGRNSGKWTTFQGPQIENFKALAHITMHMIGATKVKTWSRAWLI